MPRGRAVARSPRPATGFPVAIVGIGCRFPGARGPAALWQLLRNGVDAITEVPRERFDVDRVYDPRPKVPGKINTRFGGFIPDVDQFDPYFFGISPREAVGMDPQHRLLLEVSWEALEDAGFPTDRLAGSRTGVFVGMCTNDYEHLIEDAADLDIYLAAGNARSVLSGRISYALGLEGPSLVTDTACSSSLVAVHLACQSLAAGECGVALAGGVNLVLAAAASVGFCQAQMLAPDGRCKAFDARANGFVRSDGVGVVVLKPLSQALADADRVYAVIRGSAVNNDGRSGGLLMTPSRAGQAAVLREAYRSAGISPGQVQYVEAHGTGTAVGDPVEALALGEVLAEGRAPGGRCAIGSVKSNIGHLEGAAGVAGLIKTALALKHREIPASLHVDRLNPEIPWDALPLVVQRERAPWPGGARPPVAGVSAFGISGTNAHVVLEGPPDRRARRAAEPPEPLLLTLSAHSVEALHTAARLHAELVRGGDMTPSLRDMCYTAAARRTHHDHRLAVVAESHEDLAEHLEAFVAGEPRRGMSTGRRIRGHIPKVVFVFPGQGSQWVGMAADLSEREPAFREALEQCDAAIRAEVGWSVMEELAADDVHSRLGDVDVVQPTLFAVQVALAALWRAWGVEPDAVVGHSLGEVAAAHVAGALGLADAVRVICRRSLIVKRRASGHGGMAVVGLSPEAVGGLLAPFGTRISIAARNGPSTTVVAGDPTALQDLGRAVEEQGALFQVVKVDYASHTAQMDPLRPELLEALAGIQGCAPALPMMSTVTGAPLGDQPCDTTYWMRNLREPVLFAQAVERLAADGHEIFLEVSPHPVLTGAVAECVRSTGRSATVLASLRRGEDGRASLLGALGALHAAGRAVHWGRLYPRGGRVVTLPFYPWQRERFWLHGEKTALGSAPRARRRAGAHPLLGEYVCAAAGSETHFWESELSLRAFPYLADHRVQGIAVLPAAAYIEMALAAARQAFGEGTQTVDQLQFKKALFLPDEGAWTLQITLSRQMVGEASIQFWGRPVGAAGPATAWTLHTSGVVRLGGPTREAPRSEPPEAIRALCPDAVGAPALYEGMRQLGLEYGESFRGVEEIWRRDGEAIARLRLTDAVTAEAPAYQVHPALLDACFHALGTAVVDSRGGAPRGTYLPVRVGTVRFHRRPVGDLWSHVRLRGDPSGIAALAEGEVFVLDGDGNLILEVHGLGFQALEARPRDGTADIGDALYEIRWEPQRRDESRAAGVARERGTWLVLADEGGVGDALQVALEARGERCIVATPGPEYSASAPGRYRVDPARPEDIRRLLTGALTSDQPACRGVVHLWGADTEAFEDATLASIEQAQDRGCLSALSLVQTLVGGGPARKPRLWIVTRGVQPVGEPATPLAVAQAPLWGLGRVVSMEHPELICTKVDLSLAATPAEVASLADELWAGGPEDQVALRGEARYVARLVRSATEANQEKRQVAPDDQAFVLEVPTLGILDNFLLRAKRRRPPGPGEVEVRVRAVGLNFRDVLIAMGLVPPIIEGSLDFGFESSGTVVAVGDGVERFRVGDDVLVAGPGCFGPYATTLARYLVPKPDHLSFAEAATIPVAFATAYYSLCTVGHLAKGERVLIHAAAGGVGLAAVQIAQHVGAEIFATAGSPEKREFLRSLGVRHVMDSRSLDFAEEVLQLTGGEGVDVVLNSLAGDFISKSLATLRPWGRFLEIGKIDVLQNSPLGLRHLERNISFHVIDLAQLSLQRPDLSDALLRETMAHFATGALRPLPHRVFPISEAVEAFRHMAQARHIGKVVVSVEEASAWVVPARLEPLALRADATYLITGGLGGLGLTVARWMVERGARHLVLSGRSGAVSGAAADAIRAMEAAAAEVRVIPSDVSRESDVAALLEEIGRSMPPLRGIVHSAMVLDDGILVQLTPDRVRTPMAPKVAGAWNLHALTTGLPLDFFALFSSAASVLASPGQGSYVAANAFLDALAHHRRALGLPAVVINWGLWAEVGWAARPDISARLVALGILPIPPAQGLRLLEHALGQDTPQVVAMAVDWGQLLRGASPPFMQHLAEEVKTRPGPARAGRSRDGLTRDKLLAADAGERLGILEAALVEQIARVLRCAPSKVDVHQPLNTLGIDSLMAVEFKNRIEADLETSLPVVALLQGPTVSQLAVTLLDQLVASAPPVAAPPIRSREPGADVLAMVDQLSDAEVDAMLRGMLDGKPAEPAAEPVGEQPVD